MRMLLNALGVLGFIGGMAALIYALAIALPVVNDTGTAIYPKVTFYGIVAVAMFGFAGLCIANAGRVYLPPPKP